MAFVYDLRRLTDKASVLGFLELDEATFDRVATFDPSAGNSAEPTFPPFYRHDIPKRNPARGVRTIWEAAELGYTYKALSRRLDNFFRHALTTYPHPRAFGYVTGRNIAENAANHCGRRFLLTVDIREFFPSISAERVRQLMLSTGVSADLAELLSQFVTIEGKLPLGLASSPAIANAICVPLDVDLHTLASTTDAAYSRYADDLTFSSNVKCPSIDTIRTLVRKQGFSLEDSKTRQSTIGQAHFVTGLSVSDPAQPHVPKKKKRRLRQELHYAQKYTLQGHFKHEGIHGLAHRQQAVNRIDGSVKFIAYHEPRLASQLKTTWAKVLLESGWAPSFAPKNTAGEPLVLVFDEAEFKWRDRHCLALGVSVSPRQHIIDDATNDILNSVTSDLWADGKPDIIKKKGIHFADATEDLKMRYVEAMQLLPFQGYVALAELHDAGAYEATYLRLLQSIIRRRLIAADGRDAQLYFEQNDKVSQSAIKTTIVDALKALEKHNNRRPKSLSVGFRGKPNPSLSAPDFLLGVLARYLASGPDNVSPLPRPKHMFERIRDKYRLILDCDTGVEYSRRTPIAP